MKFEDMTITKEAIRKAIEDKIDAGIELEDIEQDYTAALRFKLISLDEWAYAMEQIWA